MACTPEAPPTNTACRTFIYDAAHENISEVFQLHPFELRFYIVSKGSHIDRITSSEVGGASVVGKTKNVVWLAWLGGFTIARGVGRFETPEMRCVTRAAGAARTETACFGKSDGTLWLEYVSDDQGVLEYQRHADSEFGFQMRRRGACALSYRTIDALPVSEKL